MKNNSAPGSDGIPIEFYKCFWTKLKTHLMEAYRYSYNKGQFTPSQTLGIITLLHKGKDLNKGDLNNWRPISLTNTDYKIFTKVLANRLTLVLHKIVSKDQSGFI